MKEGKKAQIYKEQHLSSDCHLLKLPDWVENSMFTRIRQSYSQKI